MGGTLSILAQLPSVPTPCAAEMGPHLLPNLPMEIMFDILSRLPIKLLCQFMSVSKSWKALITDPHFGNLHFQHQQLSKKNYESYNYNQLIISTSNTYPNSLYVINPQLQTRVRVSNLWDCQFPLHILGSYNGVVLIGGPNNINLALWNPLNRNVKFIRSAPHTPELYGICYDSDFKLVMALETNSESPLTVQLFSSKLDSWKTITGDFSYRALKQNYGNRGAATLNGVPHWIVRRNINDTSGSQNLVVYFDPTEEKFGEIHLPRLDFHRKYFDLTIIGENLCFVEKGLREVSVWLMKKYSPSWSKMFVVRLDRKDLFYFFLLPLCYVNGEEEVILRDEKTFLLYNLKENTLKRCKPAKGCNMLETACYMESLVSP